MQVTAVGIPGNPLSSLVDTTMAIITSESFSEPWVAPDAAPCISPRRIANVLSAPVIPGMTDILSQPSASANKGSSKWTAGGSKKCLALKVGWFFPAQFLVDGKGCRTGG